MTATCGIPVFGVPCQLPAGHDGSHVVTGNAVQNAALLPMDEQVERHLEAIATVHERVACPRCGQPAGSRCVRAGARAISAPPLKHSHVQRLNADNLYLR